MSDLVQSETEISLILRERLPSWLTPHLGRGAVELTSAIRLAGGYSNETWKVRCEFDSEGARGSLEFVVRWCPKGALFYPADVSGQFALLKALEPTPVPAPVPLWLELDAEILGEPFLTMQLVPGKSVPRVFALEDPERDAKLTAYVRALAGIHELDWRGFGLGSVLHEVDAPDCAKVALEGVVEHVLSRGFANDAIVDRALCWLHESLPTSSDVTLIHGDPNVSNYRFDGTSVVAILDWDLARLSDPIWDVAAYCNSMAKYFAAEPPDVRRSEKERFLELYQEATGRSLENLRFWETLSALRAASNNSHPAMKTIQTPVFWEMLERL